MDLEPFTSKKYGRRELFGALVLVVLFVTTLAVALIAGSISEDQPSPSEAEGLVPTDATPMDDMEDDGTPGDGDGNTSQENQTRDPSKKEQNGSTEDGTGESPETKPPERDSSTPRSTAGNNTQISMTTLTEIDTPKVVDISDTVSNRSPAPDHFEGGLYIVRANTSEGSMEAGVVTPDGKRRVLVEVLNGGEAATAIGLEEGGYEVWTEADERWRLEFFRPGETAVVSSPSIREIGAGSRVYGPLEGGGRKYHLRFENKAGDHVEVYGVDVDGDVFEVFLNQTGLSEVETNYSHVDPHYLTVKTTSDDWTITLRAR